ncbi:hypothetical protein [Roseateles sp. LYH14W]|uniref:Transcriptional regulator n=1 Tax=Pelomonas parva TaxID=3299032 RepID=A0ABW7F3B0_9BURK
MNFFRRWHAHQEFRRHFGHPVTRPADGCAGHLAAPRAVTALADFVDSLDAEQRQLLRLMMQGVSRDRRQA